MFLVAGIILFILLIVLHEYGHFLVAKRNKVEVEEFGIFFPPKIAGKKMGKGIFEGYYTINALPLGGFVKLKGENNQDKRKGSYGASSFWVKTKITLAGVLTNYAVGVLIFVGLAFFGLPKFFDNQWFIAADVVAGETVVYVVAIDEGPPAANAGIEDLDIISSVDGVAVFTANDLVREIKKRPGQTVDFEFEDYSNDDLAKVSQVTIGEKLVDEAGEEELIGFIGAGVGDGRSSFDELDAPVWAAPVNGTLLATQLGLETFKSIGGAVVSLFDGDTAEASKNVSGPVGIVDFLKNDVNDFETLVTIMGNLSIALAVANLLPIPGLDGGRFYTIAAFKLMKKDLTEELEQKINAVGVILLLTLVVLITFSDISKL